MYIFNANTNILTWKTVKHSVGFRIYIIIMTNNMTTVNMTTVNMANLADQTCTMTRTKLMVEKSFIWNNETEKQIRFLWLWVVTHENQPYVKSILRNFVLIFSKQHQLFNLGIYHLLCFICLENNLVFQKNNWVNTLKSSWSV